MSYTSLVFAAFVAITILVYYLFPVKKYQWTVLLVAGIVFYLWFSVRYGVFILFTIFTIWLSGLLMSSIEDETKRIVKENKETWSKEERKAFKKKAENKKLVILVIALVLNFGILGLIKYFDAFAGSLFGRFFGEPGEDGVIRLLMPLGISFYTFQSTGYLIDLYRGNVEAEKNPFKLGLFISYFPQIVQGPIGQFEKLHHQLIAEHRPEWIRFKQGGELILWGLLKKLIIADRAVVAISAFQEDVASHTGTVTLFVALLYALQLYADFSGGIDISRGVSQMLGVDLAINFRRPYFAKSINEYWRRWHISLGEWMKNYVFYSLAVSDPFLKLGRKVNKNLPTAIASFIVFVLVGIWHGSNSKYLAFGIWNGLLVALSVMLAPTFEKMAEKLKINVKSKIWQLFQMGRTFILVLVGYYFDIAPSFSGAMLMLKKTATNLTLAGLKSGVKELGLGLFDYKVIMVAGLVLLYFSIRLEMKNLETPGELLEERKGWVQWIVIFIAILLLITWGWYGPGYDPAEFVYMQF